MLSKWTSIGALALTLGFFAVPASAAPLGVNGVQAETSQSTTAEPVSYRRCWWRDGHRHCRWVEDTYGYGPSVGIYVGPNGHRHHRR
jgi:hypothetical protein